MNRFAFALSKYGFWACVAIAAGSMLAAIWLGDARFATTGLVFIALAIIAGVSYMVVAESQAQAWDDEDHNPDVYVHNDPGDPPRSLRT